MSTLAHKGTHCGCANCLAGQREKMIDRLTRDSLHIAVRHAQEHPESWAPEARPSGFPTMPATLPGTPFKLKWTKEVRINTLPKVGAGPVPAGTDPEFVRLFDQPGPNLIYAVVRNGSKRPLYVGHVARAKRTMRIRLDEHRKGKKSSHFSSATAQLTAMLASSTDLYLVLGTYEKTPPYRKNPNMTRAIEGLVQEITRPKMWSKKVTSFEDEDEEDEADLAELLEGEL